MSRFLFPRRTATNRTEALKTIVLAGESTDRDTEKYLLGEGNIVVARTGATVEYAKRIHESHPDSVFVSYLMRLKPKNLQGNIFLEIAIESGDFKNLISIFFSGSAQPQAN